MNWLNYPLLPAVTILRACVACGGQPPGQYLDDQAGRDAHQAAAGHAPIAGRALCPIAGVGT